MIGGSPIIPIIPIIPIAPIPPTIFQAKRLCCVFDRVAEGQFWNYFLKKLGESLALWKIYAIFAVPNERFFSLCGPRDVAQPG